MCARPNKLGTCTGRSRMSTVLDALEGMRAGALADEAAAHEMDDVLTASVPGVRVVPIGEASGSPSKVRSCTPIMYSATTVLFKDMVGRGRMVAAVLFLRKRPVPCECRSLELFGAPFLFHSQQICM